MFKLPQKHEVYQFISETHLVEKLQCSSTDAESAYTKKVKHPLAWGHVTALSYLLSLIDKQDFPAREPHTLSNTFKSQDALFWLKESHIKLTSSLLLDPLNEHSNAPIKPSQLGTYRNVPVNNTFARAPQPELIPAILHLWLIELSTLHHLIKPKLDIVQGITKDQFKSMENFVNEIPVLFSTVQPFQIANNRLGRLVSNTLRIAWRMPFIPNVGDHYDQFKLDLESFQINKLPLLIQQAKTIKY